MSSELTVLGTAEDPSRLPNDAERNKRDTKESSIPSLVLLTRSIIR